MPVFMNMLQMFDGSFFVISVTFHKQMYRMCEGSLSNEGDYVVVFTAVDSECVKLMCIMFSICNGGD